MMKINREVDQRLYDRGTKIFEADVPQGSTVWKLTKAQFFPVGDGPGFSGGRHHVYIEAVDENGSPVEGEPFIFSWADKRIPVISNGKSGFDAANHPFSAGRNAFSVRKENGDSVEGIGMGQDTPDGWNAGEHTSTLLRYQRTVETGENEIPEEPETGEGPEIPEEPEDRNLLATILLFDDGTYEFKNKLPEN